MLTLEKTLTYFEIVDMKKLLMPSVAFELQIIKCCVNDEGHFAEL